MVVGDEKLKSKSRVLVAEGIEFLADQVMDSGVLKDVPIVGWAAKIISAKNTIKDNLYAAKLNKFLTNLHDIPDCKIEVLRNHILTHDEEVNHLCEKIIQSLDSITDVSKSSLISDLFLAYLDGVIDKRNFRECVDVTCYVSIDYLIWFIESGFLFYTQLKDISNRFSVIPTFILSTPLVEPVISEGDLEGIPKGEICYSTSKLGNNYRKAIKHAKELHERNKNS